jgi:LPS-assembly lipoprotein
MSWRRRLASVAAAGLLAGCGFHPLYEESGDRPEALADRLAAIKVSQIGEHFGQVMTNALDDGLNPNARRVPAQYQLDVALREVTFAFSARADGTPSRNQLTLIATWVLRQAGDNKAVASGMTKSNVGYDVLNNDYTNVVSSNNNELRAVRDLSDEIQASIAAYFQNHPAA